MQLGAKSLAKLNGVNQKLVDVVKLAIQLTEQDFSVNCGLRTLAEQKALLKSGATTTLNSRHISGNAVDLVPFVDGKANWDWKYVYPVAEAMRKAAKQLNVTIRWGGEWSSNFTATTLPTETLVAQYVASRKKIGKNAFIDGPHFEIPA